jgi:hypothetical protein
MLIAMDTPLGQALRWMFTIMPAWFQSQDNSLRLHKHLPHSQDLGLKVHERDIMRSRPRSATRVLMRPVKSYRPSVMPWFSDCQAIIRYSAECVSAVYYRSLPKYSRRTAYGIRVHVCLCTRESGSVSCCMGARHATSESWSLIHL